MNNDIHYNYNKLADLDYLLSLSSLSEQKRIEIQRQKMNVQNRIEYLERREKESQLKQVPIEESQQKSSIITILLFIPCFFLIYYISYYFFSIILKLG